MKTKFFQVYLMPDGYYYNIPGNEPFDVPIKVGPYLSKDKAQSDCAEHEAMY